MAVRFNNIAFGFESTFFVMVIRLIPSKPPEPLSSLTDRNEYTHHMSFQEVTEHNKYFNRQFTHTENHKFLLWYAGVCEMCHQQAPVSI